MATVQQSELFCPKEEPSISFSGLFAQIVFNRPLDQPFTYFVPATLADTLTVGKRVLAPFGRGNRPAIGFCVETTERLPDRSVKGILKVLDEEPLLTPPLLRLTRWMADYYLCGWGQVLDAVLPAGAKQQSGTRVAIFLRAVPLSERPAAAAKLTPKQAGAMAILEEFGPMEGRQLARMARCGMAVFLQLVRKGYARREEQRTEHFRPEPVAPASELPFTLNPDQLRAQTAVEEALARGGFHAFLLHGVTGSGKTEVYLQAIEKTVKGGKEALVIVPEISLTPQTIQRFRGRFSRVAVLHSHLGDAERGWQWRQIAAGRMQVIVGARSAVFAPTRNLGLIIVDEEHEGSFKQDSTPRYHGRDVAVMRARLEGIPIVLGSATPSLESWHNAERGQYTLLSLPKRVLDLPLPHVGMIDLRHETPPRGRYRALSLPLERSMKDALAKGGQIILLLNRRGFDTYLLCLACGHVVQCKFCDVALTHHRQKDLALCHYCGYETDPPERCPECALAQIRFLGQGTQKLEAEIEKKFPGVRAERVDSDSMRRPGSYGKVLDAFRKGEIRILFGTQMIAKGLDFPNVTLVGVIDADTALHMPDFRSGERTFQLLAQVAGRTGRGPSGGRVLVQTYNPENQSIALAARHDYLSFVMQELKARKEHSYPPYSRMARIIIRSRQQKSVEKFSEQMADAFQAALRSRVEPAGERRTPSVRLLGPAPAPLFKLQGYFRHHCQLQARTSGVLHDVLKSALSSHRPASDVDLTVDIDPQGML